MRHIKRILTEGIPHFQYRSQIYKFLVSMAMMPVVDIVSCVKIIMFLMVIINHNGITFKSNDMHETT